MQAVRISMANLSRASYLLFGLMASNGALNEGRDLHDVRLRQFASEVRHALVAERSVETMPFKSVISSAGTGVAVVEFCASAL